jgi:hypothetical protein
MEASVDNTLNFGPRSRKNQPLTNDSETLVPGGLVFTNNRGQIIFVNQPFLELLGFDRRAAIMGKALHQVLGVGSGDVSDLVETSRDRGDATRSVRLGVLDKQGTEHCLMLESMPAFDSSNRFLGLNIIVKSIHESVFTSQQLTVKPVISQDAAERYATACPLPVGEQKIEETKGERLREFFTEQIDGLQILMARVAGLRVREAMEMIFNETTQKHLWPAAMVDGNVYLDRVAEDPAIYAVLLRELANYAAVVIGWNTVSVEMRQVENRFDASIIALAIESGLRQVYVRPLE